MENLGAVLESDGILDAVVAALDHQSPYCVTAAAGILLVVGIFPCISKRLLKSSQAIPALVRVIERASPPADLQTTGLYGRWVCRQSVFLSPHTCVAVVMFSVQLRVSSIPGTPALV